MDRYREGVEYGSLQWKKLTSHVGTFLAKIDVIETPECWWCGEAEQSVEHLYTKCRRWRKKRRKIVRKLYTEGVRWQAQAERRSLAELLANERATKPLLRFFQVTKIGGRDSPKAAVTHSGETKRKWQNKGAKPGFIIMYVET